MLSAFPLLALLLCGRLGMTSFLLCAYMLCTSNVGDEALMLQFHAQVRAGRVGLCLWPGVAPGHQHHAGPGPRGRGGGCGVRMYAAGGMGREAATACGKGAARRVAAGTLPSQLPR